MHGFIQAYLQGVHNTMTALAADIAATAVTQETQNRFTAMEQGMTAVGQRIEMASQTWEARFGTLSALVTTMGAGGTDKKKVDITESKPVNNLKEFGGGDREQFREWTRTMVDVIQRLRPGARTVLREIDVTDNDLWNKAARRGVQLFSISAGVVRTLNEDIWWILSQKTTGGTLSMVTAVEEGMGLEAFRKISRWYTNMNQVSIHEFRGKVMNPEPATEDHDVAERIEEWVADVMRLKRIDKATNNMPDGYFLSALRRILCGMLQESVDLLCSERDEPSWEEVLGRVRKYANLRRIDLTLRKRNDMHVDEARGTHGRWNEWIKPGNYQGKGPGP